MKCFLCDQIPYIQNYFHISPKKNWNGAEKDNDKVEQRICWFLLQSIICQEKEDSRNGIPFIESIIGINSQLFPYLIYISSDFAVTDV